AQRATFVRSQTVWVLFGDVFVLSSRHTVSRVLIDVSDATIASTNGSRFRARSAASWSSSARITPLPAARARARGPRARRDRERLGGPGELDRFAPVPLHDLLAASVGVQGAQLGNKEEARVKDGRREHGAIRRDHQR